MVLAVVLIKGAGQQQMGNTFQICMHRVGLSIPSAILLQSSGPEPLV